MNTASGEATYNEPFWLPVIGLGLLLLSIVVILLGAQFPSVFIWPLQFFFNVDITYVDANYSVLGAEIPFRSYYRLLSDGGYGLISAIWSYPVVLLFYVGVATAIAALIGGPLRLIRYKEVFDEAFEFGSKKMVLINYAVFGILTFVSSFFYLMHVDFFGLELNDVSSATYHPSDAVYHVELANGDVSLWSVEVDENNKDRLIIKDNRALTDNITHLDIRAENADRTEIFKQHSDEVVGALPNLKIVKARRNIWIINESPIYVKSFSTLTYLEEVGSIDDLIEQNPQLASGVIKATLISDSILRLKSKQGQSYDLDLSKNQLIKSLSMYDASSEKPFQLIDSQYGYSQLSLVSETLEQRDFDNQLFVKAKLAFQDENKAVVWGTARLSKNDDLFLTSISKKGIFEWSVSIDQYFDVSGSSDIEAVTDGKNLVFTVKHDNKVLGFLAFDRFNGEYQWRIVYGDNSKESEES